MEEDGTTAGWQPLMDDDNGIFTDRLEVAGGWIYRVMFFRDGVDGGNTTALCFVPWPPK